MAQNHLPSKIGISLQGADINDCLTSNNAFATVIHWGRCAKNNQFMECHRPHNFPKPPFCLISGTQLWKRLGMDRSETKREYTLYRLRLSSSYRSYLSPHCVAASHCSSQLCIHSSQSCMMIYLIAPHVVGQARWLPPCHHVPVQEGQTL